VEVLVQVNIKEGNRNCYLLSIIIENHSIGWCTPLLVSFNYQKSIY